MGYPWKSLWKNKQYLIPLWKYLMRTWILKVLKSSAERNFFFPAIILQNFPVFSTITSLNFPQGWSVIETVFEEAELVGDSYSSKLLWYFLSLAPVGKFALVLCIYTYHLVHDKAGCFLSRWIMMQWSLFIEPKILPLTEEGLPHEGWKWMSVKREFLDHIALEVTLLVIHVFTYVILNVIVMAPEVVYKITQHSFKCRVKVIEKRE